MDLWVDWVAPMNTSANSMDIRYTVYPNPWAQWMMMVQLQAFLKHVLLYQLLQVV